jgi:hypothetical protein
MRSAPPPSSSPMLLRLRLLLLSELAPPASISTEGDSRVCFRSRRINVEGAREHGAREQGVVRAEYGRRSGGMDGGRRHGRVDWGPETILPCF